MRGFWALLLIVAAVALLVAGYYAYGGSGAIPSTLKQLLDGNFWSALFQRFYRGLYG